MTKPLPVIVTFPGNGTTSFSTGSGANCLIGTDAAAVSVAKPVCAATRAGNLCYDLQNSKSTLSPYRAKSTSNGLSVSRTISG